MAEERVQRRLAAILATDVVGYSRLMRADEIRTLDELRKLRRETFDPKISEHNGRIVKLMGDGALVEFASAVDAVSCAIEIQKELATYNAPIPEEYKTLFRIGINVGDIIVEGDDIYGDGVNIAARVESLADPGGIFLSRTARDQVRDKMQIHLEDRGEQAVKNIARPIGIFRVVAEGEKAPSSKTATENTEAAPTPSELSIAVLAFNNMSDDADQEYFSDGISEDIITDLSKLANLHVIARNSSFVYKGQAVSIPNVGNELGVRYVLEGSVRKAGNRVRVTAQLIDTTTGGHVWADRYDRDLADIFAVQDELTQEIVSALKVTLTPDDQSRLAHKREIDIDAYNFFLRGREQTRLHTRMGNIDGRKLLNRATELAPDYAAAHACIAFTHVMDYANGWSDNPEHQLQSGLELAQRATKMDDEEPLAHFALGVGHMWNKELDQSMAESQRCLELEPNSADGYLALAHALIFNSEPAAAIDRLETYINLDPLYPDLMLHFMAEARISLRQFEEAITILKQRLERNPSSETAYALLASCYGNLDRIEEGKAALAALLKLVPDFSLDWKQRVLPFKNLSDFEIRANGLHKVGLP
jgi:adenylate cyclase